MSKNTKEEAIERLLTALPHFRHAAESAMLENSGAVLKLAIITVLPDKSGKVACQFDLGEFLKDLSLAIGENLTPEELAEKDLEARAERFLQVHGLKG